MLWFVSLFYMFSCLWQSILSLVVCDCYSTLSSNLFDYLTYFVFFLVFFFFNDPATTEFYTYCHTLPLHDALPCFSIAALLVTLVRLFGFQGEQIVAQPTIILLLAVPILIQVYLNSGLAYYLNRVTGEQHCVAGPSALIGASNFFELRSEEHTSELQSLMRISYAVFCLKKKT